MTDGITPIHGKSLKMLHLHTLQSQVGKYAPPRTHPVQCADFRNLAYTLRISPTRYVQKGSKPF